MSLHFEESLNVRLEQWFPNYSPRHIAAPPDVIRCAAPCI